MMAEVLAWYPRWMSVRRIPMVEFVVHECREAIVRDGLAAMEARAAGRDAEADLLKAGADMLTQTPELAAWLRQLGPPLDLLAIAYLDGEKHLRVSLAMDALVDACAGADPRSSFAWMATPTDVFAVPQALAEDVMRAYQDRGTLKRLAQAGLRAGSGGRSFQPAIERLIDADDGSRWGVVDCLVIEQGPNYALAKRLQQWRALAVRAAGHVASINVAPSTTTRAWVTRCTSAITAGVLPAPPAITLPTTSTGPG